MKTDIYQEITNNIIELMEQGGNFTMPFNSLASGLPFNYTTGKNYNGINTIMLAFFGGGDSAFATYKQWQEKGAQVKKGQKGKRILFFKMLDKHDKKTGKDYQIPLARYSTVFGLSQVEGIETEQKENNVITIEHVDQYVKNTGADIVEANQGAFYSPGHDLINMPMKSEFLATEHSTETENYYSTLFHELTHWTGAKHRLDRFEDRTRENYAFEELIAELGAAFQCAKLNVTSETRADHAHYLNTWLKALKNDKKFIFQAASKAQKAVDYLESLQNKQALAA